MTAFHKTFAIALFCGAVGFAHAGHAAQPTNPAAGTITENGAKNSADTQTRTLPARGADALKRTAVSSPHSRRDRRAGPHGWNGHSRPRRKTAQRRTPCEARS